MSVKVHRIVMCVVDHDEIGAAGVRAEIEHVRYPNQCISPRVVAAGVRAEIDWSDSHPLNRNATSRAEFARLFSDAHVELRAEIDRLGNALAESKRLGMAAVYAGRNCLDHEEDGRNHEFSAIATALEALP